MDVAADLHADLVQRLVTAARRHVVKEDEAVGTVVRVVGVQTVGQEISGVLQRAAAVYGVGDANNRFGVEEVAHSLTKCSHVIVLGHSGLSELRPKDVLDK